jgi:IMP cyclohydrolase
MLDNRKNAYIIEIDRKNFLEFLYVYYNEKDMDTIENKLKTDIKNEDAFRKVLMASEYNIKDFYSYSIHYFSRIFNKLTIKKIKAYLDSSDYL